MIAIRKFLGGMLVLVLIVIVTILGVEGASSFYLFLKDYRNVGLPAVAARPFAANDTMLGWANKPDYRNTSAFGEDIGMSTGTLGERLSGVRSTEPLPGAVDSRNNVVCSGDAYTFGMGVRDAETWCARIGQMMPAVRPTNFSQVDYGLDQLVLWYKKAGVQLKPVVHVWAVTDAALEKAALPQVTGRNKPFFQMQGVEVALRNEPVPAQTEAELRQFSARRELENVRLVQVYRKLTKYDRDAEVARAMAESWPVYEKLIELAAGANGSTTHTLILYLPTTRDRRPGPPDARRVRLRAIAEKQSLPFIDLTPAYRALPADSADHLFIAPPTGGSARFTGQLSKTGHEWVASFVVPEIRGMLDRDTRMVPQKKAR